MIDLIEVAKCVYATLSTLSCDVVDYIDSSVTLPYVAIGDLDIEDSSTKDKSEINVTQYIHVYSDKKSKSEVLEILNKINLLLSNISSDKFQIYMSDNKQTITQESKTIGGQLNGSYSNETYYHGLFLCDLKIIEKVV